ncbi:MAG: hypothetical protein WA708_12780 [Acidobacteriaceae bacterium]
MREIESVRRAVLGICLLWIAVSSAAWGKKSVKTVTASDGRPIRKVYIRSASPDSINSAAAQLAQDTCLSTVPAPKLADAVLDLSIALPSVGGGLPQPDVFGNSPHVQTMGNPGKGPERSASANCTDRKGKGGCTGSYNAAAGDIAAQPAAEWSGSTGENLDVSLASAGDASQELWEPDAHSKKSWSEQLRVAAGCPVCPGGHFNRHKFKTYKDWIQSECPAILVSPANP